ncbi:hypothetical protein HUN08_13310 [Gordonia sp. X0973]|nr:hypothetical protein HUN08_13310 [Gordonia sp. X0973]
MVQVVHSNRRGSRTIDHIGSAHPEAELAALRSVAVERLSAGQGQLELGVAGAGAGGPSKLDSLRVLAEVGVEASSYATVKRRLAVYAQAARRWRLAATCAVHAGLGPATLVLYDVTKLYFADS